MPDLPPITVIPHAEVHIGERVTVIRGPHKGMTGIVLGIPTYRQATVKPDLACDPDHKLLNFQDTDLRVEASK